MDQVIRIEKTFQQRLQEYKDIFTGGSPFSLPKIRQSFSFFVELSVDPSGWQAIWKIPRIDCESFKISFPTVVMVSVENIDVIKLTSAVKILAVLDEDTHLPEMHVVPLIELWPLRTQDRTSDLNINNTAAALDVVRFFYNNLYMPWDEEKETYDWMGYHLENRLQLIYDLNSGNLPVKMAQDLRSLLTNAKHLQELLQYESLEEKLIEIELSLLNIQKEVELLENPLARKVLINRAKRSEDTVGGKCWLIIDRGTPQDYLNFLKDARGRITAKKSVKFAPNLSEALKGAAVGDTFILKPGNHVINHTQALETGCTLKSASPSENAIITSPSSYVMFDFHADTILEDLIINTTSQCAIFVRRGKLTLINCKIIDDSYSYKRQGVVVLSGAAIELKNCTLVGLQMAIVGNKNSSITLENCEIMNVQYGLKMYDDCVAKLEDTRIHDCEENGIWIETEKCQFSKQPIIGGFPILNE